MIQSAKWSYCIFIDQLTFVHNLRWLKSAVKDKTLRQNIFFSLNFIRFIYKARHYSTKGCKGFQPSLFSAAVSLQQLPLTCVVPDIACDLHKVPLLSSSLPAVHSILLARYCFPFGWGSLGNDTGKQPLVSVERGCWEATVNDAAPAQIFFFFLPDQVSWRLCLYWRGVATFQFQLWDFYFFSEGCHFFFSRLNLIIIHSPSPWVWWGFRDNFTPNWYSSSHT